MGFLRAIRTRTWLAWVTVCLVLFVGSAAPADDPDGLDFFERKIRPLFVTNCHACHAGPKTESGLNLATRAGFSQGAESGPIVVAGKPAESLLLTVVGYAADTKMPPEGKLSDQEIADLTHWVQIGAPWPTDEVPSADPALARNTVLRPSGQPITDADRDFWSFQPIGDPPRPEVKEAAWAKTSLDDFILARLEQGGLRHAKPADKQTLIRRITFDLTGLPPTPQEIDDFLADTSAEAYAKVVDRLLASPRLGERWGRYWLDVARYGEDQAHTFGARGYPQGWVYRDWVVRALNTDLPFNQFVEQQIAGDAQARAPNQPAADASPQDKGPLVALGYFALGPVYYSDAGCAPKAAADELDDRVDTLCAGFLGLTVACARCHDHKFDPITQRDYYALAGVFFSSSYHEAPLAEPQVVAEYEAGQSAIAARQQAVQKFQTEAGAKLARAAAENSAAYLMAVWTMAHPAAGAPPMSVADAAKAASLHDFVLERWQKYFVPENASKLEALAAWFALVASPNAVPGEVPAEAVDCANTFQSLVRETLAQRDTLETQYQQALAAASEAEKPNVPKPQLEHARAALLSALLDENGLCAVPGDRVEGLLDDEGKAQLAALRGQLEEVQKAAPAKYLVAHSLTDGNVADMPIYVRGNPARPGESVPRGFLEILSPALQPSEAASTGETPSGESSSVDPANERLRFTQGSGRVELARAIASPRNPLTARVIVNRIWQQHFGRGIVGTPSNFGALGERPTHPELLDHLARHLIDSGWSLKSLHRLILLSATYQQSCDLDAAGVAADPENRLLWRMNRRRLDVESWRDALLNVAGRLRSDLGGPSQDLGSPDNQRRTLYGTISRHNLNSLLRLFDFPDPNITSARRATTTVPLQQLFVLNSEFMVAQARALAARLHSLAPTDDAARITTAFRLLYGRLPGDEDYQLGLEFLSAAGSQTQASASQLTPWEQYCQVLLGANEFAFVD